MSFAAGFSWFHLIPAVDEGFLPFAHGHDYLFISACFVCLLVCTFALLANRALAAKRASASGLAIYEADESLSLFTLAENLVGFIKGMSDGILDRDAQRRFTPFIGGLFTYIFVCNILSIVPGFQPPTDDINANVGMAIIVTLVYWIVGITSDLKNFIAHITGPVLLLAPLIGAIELLGLLAIRPATLVLRLTGNMFADHTVFSIISGLVPFLAPVPFLALAIIVSTVQAFVFSLLTIIYLSLSLPHGDEHH